MARPKGSLNNRTKALLDQIAEKWPGYHPVVALCAIANDESLPLEMRFQAHKEAAQYIEPKRKAVEMDSFTEISAGNVTWKVKLVGNSDADQKEA